MVEIVEGIHFYATGVLTQRQQRGQPHPFTYHHFALLIAQLNAQCVIETTDGPCAALRFLLVHDHNTQAAVTFPQQDDADQRNAEQGHAVVIPQQNMHIPVRATTLLKPFMKSLGAKSAASFMGFAPAAIMFAYAALAAGLHAVDTVVPKVLLTMKSAAELADVRSAAFRDYLTRGREDEAKQYGDLTNPKTNRRTVFSSNPLHRDFLQAFVLLGIAIDLVPANPPAPPGTSATAYVQRVTEPQLLSLIDHLACLIVTPQSNTGIAGYAPGETQTTVLDVVACVYPALRNYLASTSPQFILPTAARPIIAHLVTKVGNLFLRDDTYVESSRDNARGDPVLDKQQFTPPFAHRDGDFYCFTPTRLIDEYCRTILPNPANLASRKAHIVRMLTVIGETKEFVPTTRVEEQHCGTATSWQHRLRRKATYVMDYLHKNNAFLKSSPYRPAVVGHQLDSCSKAFSSTPHWTPGIMLVTCACSKRRCYHGHFMDQHESVQSPFDILTGRFPGGCPPFVIYDNACHLLMYCMQREPSWFWRCRFVVDRFHEPNHVSSCSSSLHASSYMSGPLSAANSEAVEQLNKVLRARLETRLRFMNLNHAVVALLVFLFWYNNT